MVELRSAERWILSSRHSVRGTVVWWPGGSELPAVAVVEVCDGCAVGCGVIMELRQL